MSLTDRQMSCGAENVAQDDDLILITNQGTLVRTPVDQIRTAGRVTQGFANLYLVVKRSSMYNGSLKPKWQRPPQMRKRMPVNLSPGPAPLAHRPWISYLNDLEPGQPGYRLLTESPHSPCSIDFIKQLENKLLDSLSLNVTHGPFLWLDLHELFLPSIVFTINSIML